MKTRPMFPSNPLERDLSTPTKQSEIGKGDVSTVKRTKSPGHKSRGCSRCKPRVTPRSDSGVNSERDLLRLESGCNTKFHSLPRWRRPMTQFGQHSKPANGKRLQGLEALELPPSNEAAQLIAKGFRRSFQDWCRDRTQPPTTRFERSSARRRGCSKSVRRS